MPITVKTRKMLWGRSASRCSYASCRRPLVEDDTGTDEASIVGDEAHIVALDPKGPRGKSDLTPEERDLYSNLVLLCKVHHKLVDDQPKTYTVKRLHAIKQEHLAWVASNLNVDTARQNDNEIYADYVDEWLSLAGVDEWESWSSWVLGGGQPQVAVPQFEKLERLNKYIVSRVWPQRYPALEGAFRNFARVLNDFRVVFMLHAKNLGVGSEWLVTEKFYQHAHDEESYNALSHQFEYHVDLVEDLMLELTRAANDICDLVRKSLSRRFRLHEGVLLVTRGPGMDLRFKTFRPEYSDDRRYPGLREFMIVRAERDTHVGQGVDESYFPSMTWDVG